MSTERVMEFELTGADGEALRGTVRTAGDGAGRPPVLLCHGFKGSKDSGVIPELAQRLSRAGMTAITFNFSGSGVGIDGERFSEPARFARSTFSNDVADINIVCRSLLDGRLVHGLVQAESYGLFGYSRGGGAAVLHAAASQAVSALATWAAISHTNRWDADTLAQWRVEGKRKVSDAVGTELFFNTDMLDDIENNIRALDIISAAGRVVAPWLILHGAHDDFVSVSEGEELYEVADHTRTEFRVLEGGTHSFGSLEACGLGRRLLDSAIDLTLDWFTKHMY